MVTTRAQAGKKAKPPNSDNSAQKRIEDYCVARTNLNEPALQENSDYIGSSCPHARQAPSGASTSSSHPSYRDRSNNDLASINENEGSFIDTGTWTLDPLLFENLTWPQADTRDAQGFSISPLKDWLDLNSTHSSSTPFVSPEHQMQSMCLQMRDQCCLVALTVKNTFNKLNLLYQEILEIRAKIDAVLTPEYGGPHGGNPLSAQPMPADKPPKSTSCRHCQTDKVVTNDPSKKATVLNCSKFRAGPAQSSPDQPPIFTDHILSESTANPSLHLSQDSLNLTFTNGDIMILDTWHESDVGTSSQYTSAESVGNPPLQMAHSLYVGNKHLQDSRPAITKMTEGPCHENQHITIFNWKFARAKGKWMTAQQVKLAIFKILGSDWPFEESFTCECSQPSVPYAKRGRILLTFINPECAYSFWNLLHKFKHEQISFKWGHPVTFSPRWPLESKGKLLRKTSGIKYNSRQWGDMRPSQLRTTRPLRNGKVTVKCQARPMGLSNSFPSFVSFPNNILIRQRKNLDPCRSRKYSSPSSKLFLHSDSTTQGNFPMAQVEQDCLKDRFRYRQPSRRAKIFTNSSYQANLGRADGDPSGNKAKKRIPSPAVYRDMPTCEDGNKNLLRPRQMSGFNEESYKTAFSREVWRPVST